MIVMMMVIYICNGEVSVCMYGWDGKVTKNLDKIILGEVKKMDLFLWFFLYIF